MLPTLLLSLNGHAAETGTKAPPLNGRGGARKKTAPYPPPKKSDTEMTRMYQALALHVQSARSGNPTGMMRNVFTLAKDAIELLNLQVHDNDMHLAHYLYETKPASSNMLQMMLMSYYFSKQGLPPDTPSKASHASGSLVWGANAAGGRRPPVRDQTAFSKAESLVKQAVALERLHETYTGERDGISDAVRFLDLLHSEMKAFNDGAVEYLSEATDTQVRLNDPAWFAKYRALPSTDMRWM